MPYNNSAIIDEIQCFIMLAWKQYNISMCVTVLYKCQLRLHMLNVCDYLNTNDKLYIFYIILNGGYC